MSANSGRRSERDRSAASPSRMTARGARDARAPRHSAEVARDAKRASGATSSASRQSGISAARQTNFMKYAADNRVVQAVYTFTTAFKPLFILLVVAAVAVGIYFPVRDFYIAQRTQSILQEQVAIRKKYNDSLGKEVDQYLSQEGIEDAARKDLGMTMPGEKTITVEGLDEDGNPIVKQPESTGGTDGSGDASQDGANAGDAAEGDETGSGAEDKEDSGKLKGADAADKSKTGSSSSAATDSNKEPTTSAEAEAAERAVLEDSPWYWKLLDTIFFFDGSNGMAVISTGNQADDTASE